MKKTFIERKEKGRVYTPEYMVNNILDLSGYYGSKIVKKHAIDNSCGDGAFLLQMVKRYCVESKKIGKTNSEIKNELETYIHGIEIDLIECQKCKENLNKLVETFGILNVNWDIICSDAFLVEKYNGSIDYVLGNPPYVRIHNLKEEQSSIKSRLFSQNGMTDLYIAFFEIGINMLNDTGVLSYITPNSYFNSLAASYMRKYFADNDLLEKICDLKHYQAFNATTYTAITVLNKSKINKFVEYYEFDIEKKKPVFIDELQKNEYYLSSNYYFSKKSKLKNLTNVLFNIGQSSITVKNGYATLCDDVYISEFSEKSKYSIPVIKASKGITKYAIYPYDQNGRLIAESQLKKDGETYAYLESKKAKLLKRNMDINDENIWYAYGRTQAINDTYKDKLAINSLIRTPSDFKFVKAPAGTGVYSGLYIMSDEISFDEIISALISDDFLDYVKMLGKYKSGGYYTFSSKDLKSYLDFMFSYERGLF